MTATWSSHILWNGSLALMEALSSHMDLELFAAPCQARRQQPCEQTCVLVLSMDLAEQPSRSTQMLHSSAVNQEPQSMGQEPSHTPGLPQLHQSMILAM